MIRKIYEGSYFNAFINDREMLEIESSSPGAFIMMVTLSDDGDWAHTYIEKMKEELDEIYQEFTNTSSKYSITDMFDENFNDKLKELKIR